ncbi:hypothetical protein [Leifsonia aquatica]|uniref:hypothetical protein n=1 Tax=Leifsonia aquatica TaxID=144185 RepID=UPI000467F3D1|nr:hypothetical protein [Leifsonia aquatica]
MSFDGGAEETAIRERLGTLAGGRIMDMEPDDTMVPVYPDGQGKAMPYIVLSMGVPFANPSAGRAMSDGEADIAYTLTFVVGCYAGDRNSLNALWKAVVELMVDWTPVPGNDTPVSIPYAYNGSSQQTKTRPALFSKIAAMKTTINL